jgi:inhibitor of cysteine peptidase
MRKIIFLLLTLTAILGAIVPLSLVGQPYYFGLPSELKKFSSYDELKSFLQTSGTHSGDYYSNYFGSSPIIAQPASASFAGSNIIPDYSATNIQVEGVDEADIVKTDGEYIYIVSGNKAIIVKAYPAEEAEVFSQITVNGTLKGIFINGDRLVILEENSSSYAETKTVIEVYDVSNRENPILRRNASVDGYYFDSRMIGDYVYAVINQPAYYQEEKEPILPKVCSGDEVRETSALDIYYSDVLDYSYQYTTVIAVNVQDDMSESTSETFLLGQTSSMYVSLNNIFITVPVSIDGSQSTSIHRIHIENGNIEYKKSGEVPGYILNQFSMDEYEGYFRIATTTGQVSRIQENPSSLNHVYVLDMDLNIVGKLENLAPKEKIYSARFMDNRCYLVTFKKVDPLFVIDLADPTDPKVLGELNITGYSDYLHPYDENHIIGIGKETVEAEEGNFAWYQGIKISLFDVSDVSTPKEIAKYEIGDRGTDSPVLRDHKAFLFDKSKNLLVIPVSVAEINETEYPNGVPPNAYGEFVWQGAYVFNISLDEGLTLKGRITHMENNTDLQSGYLDSNPYFVNRALYIDNLLYTISSKKIKMNDLENLAEINEVELP